MVTLWFVVVTFASLPKDGCFTYSLRVHNIHGVCTLYSLLFACTTFNITAHQPPTLRVQAIPDCATPTELRLSGSVQCRVLFESIREVSKE